jgi:hypothetical protein
MESPVYVVFMGFIFNLIICHTLLKQKNIFIFLRIVSILSIISFVYLFFQTIYVNNHKFQFGYKKPELISYLSLIISGLYIIQLYYLFHKKTKIWELSKKQNGIKTYNKEMLIISIIYFLLVGLVYPLIQNEISIMINKYFNTKNDLINNYQ